MNKYHKPHVTKKAFKERINIEGGFTLVELILAGVMTMALSLAAYSFLNNTIRMNKTAQRNMQMNADLQDAITEITDEIKSGTLLITDLSKYQSLCTKSIEGELVLGIKFPPQALRSSDYGFDTNTSNLNNSFGCPIAYILKPNQKEEAKGYTLFRNGPLVDEKGYYSDSTYITKPILYGVTPKPINQIKCNEDKIAKQIHGIQLCKDLYGKYAEIAISTEITQLGSGTSQAYMSSSAFSRINDLDLIDEVIGKDIELKKRREWRENILSHSFVIRDTYIEAPCSSYVWVKGPNWVASQSNAEKLGGDLATINTKEENDLLMNQFKKLGAKYIPIDRWGHVHLHIGLTSTVEAQEGFNKGWISGQSSDFRPQYWGVCNQIACGMGNKRDGTGVYTSMIWNVWSTSKVNQANNWNDSPNPIGLGLAEIPYISSSCNRDK